MQVLIAFLDETVEAITRELEQWQERLEERLIRTIFLSGGPPTILPHLADQPNL